MDYQYNYTVSQTLNDKVDSSRLEEEVRDSAITIALDYINVETNININLFFKAELSDDEELILDGIIAAHTGKPLPGEIPIVKANILTEGLQYVEKGDTTQEFFAAQSLIIDISSGESQKITDFSWPFVIALKSGTIFVSEDMVGDEMEVLVAPDTVVGVLTQSLDVGDTSMYVSSTVVNNIKKGYYAGIAGNGEISRVISVDIPNQVLQIYPADVSANAGSYVTMCSKVVPDLHLTQANKIEIGKGLPTAQRIPENIPIRVIYKNKNLVAKTISIFIEYLY